MNNKLDWTDFFAQLQGNERKQRYLSSKINQHLRAESLNGNDKNQQYIDDQLNCIKAKISKLDTENNVVSIFKAAGWKDKIKGVQLRKTLPIAASLLMVAVLVLQNQQIPDVTDGFIVDNSLRSGETSIQNLDHVIYTKNPEKTKDQVKEKLYKERVKYAFNQKGSKWMLLLEVNEKNKVFLNQLFSSQNIHFTETGIKLVIIQES